MIDLFGVPWEALDLVALETFLAEAGEEGVTWEAKAEEPGSGGNRLHPEKIRIAACGLANQIGGYVLIGATDENGRWELPGIESPQNEAELWLDQVLDGLHPRPVCAHKHWRLEGDRLVAALRVEPTAQTPCMTSGGQVFERVSSETRKVTEPNRMRELIVRGEKARARAESAAGDAASELFTHEEVSSKRSVWIGLGLQSASYQPDISSRLFHSRFPKFMAERFAARMISEIGERSQPRHHRAIAQEHVELGLGNERIYFVIRAHWSGRVGVLVALEGDPIIHLPLFENFVVPSWRLAADLIEHLGGYGDGRAHLAIRRQTKEEAEQRPTGSYLPGPLPPQGSIYATLPSEVHLKRPWSSDPEEPTSSVVGSMHRELSRAAGRWVYEGAPDPD